MKRGVLTIILVTIFTVSYSQDSTYCDTFKNGYFQYKRKHPNTIVYRDSNFQLEYDFRTNKWVFLKLKWFSNCEYTFTYVSSVYPSLKGAIGKTVHVKIVEHTDSSYLYHSHPVDHYGEDQYGELMKLQRQLTEAQINTMQVRFYKESGVKF